MKKILYGAALFVLFVAMGCGNSTIRSAEIYLKQNDLTNARRIITDGLPTMPQGAVKAEAYSMLAQMSASEIEGLNVQAKKANDPKEIKDLFDKRIGKIKQFNDEMTNSLQNGSQYKGKLDTLRENLWIDYFNGGVNPFNEKKWSEAILSFRMAWVLDSVNHALAAGLIGQAMLQQPNRGEEAVDWLKRAVANEQKSKPDYTSRFNIANYYYTSEKWQDAISYYDLLIALPTPADTAKEKDFRIKRNRSIANKAICLDQLNRKDEATAAYNEALKLQPDNTVLWFNLGQRYFDAASSDTTKNALPKYAEADKALLKVLELDSADADAKFLLGWSNFQQEKYAVADKYLQEYIKAKPEKRDAWIALRGSIINQIATLSEKKGNDAKLKELKERLKDINEEMKKRGFGE